jgi:hypothetical protein
MKYYSKKIFYFFITVYILAVIFALVYWYVSAGLACWGTTSQSRCIELKNDTNIFDGILPTLFASLSLLVILLQQKIHKKFGYLIIFLLPLSPIFYKYYNIIYPTTWVMDITSFQTLMQFLIFLIPFYVLGRLVKEDFFKKKSLKK